VLKGPGVWPKIESSTREDASGEIPTELRHLFV
jgi:hypothetical protein